MKRIITSESSRKIQILRAASIIAVVAIHTCAEGPVGVFVRPFLNFAVALFLGISGFLTSPGIGKAKVLKRLQRVFVPYCIWSLIYTAIRGTWEKFPMHFLTGYSCGAFYFIVVYMQLTLLAPLADRLIHSRRRSLGYLITPAAIVFEYITEFSGHEIDKPFNEVFFPVWFIYFYLGMVIRADVEDGKAGYLITAGNSGSASCKTADEGHVTTRFLAGMLAFSMVIQIAEAALWGMAGFGRMKYTQIKLGTLITSCLVILISIRWILSDERIRLSRKAAHCLVYIGNISFGIYFTHILCMDLLEMAADSLEFIIENVFPLSTLLILAVNIAAIYLIRKLFPDRFCRVLGLI